MTGRAVPEDLGLGGELARAVHKLIAAVPASHRAAAEQARARVLVDHTGWYRTGPVQDSGSTQLAGVQEAVWQDRRLQVRYRHSDGPEAGYTLDPHGLVVKGGVWYLVAEHRRRVRLWRVDRIRSVRVLAEPARHSEGAELASLWERLRAEVERPRARVVVRLRARAEVLPMVLRVTAVQRIQDGSDPQHSAPGPDGWVELTLTFRAPRAAVASLLGFGDAVEVLAPEQVRAGMIVTARAVLARYGGHDSVPGAESGI